MPGIAVSMARLRSGELALETLLGDVSRGGLSTGATLQRPGLDQLMASCYLAVRQYRVVATEACHIRCTPNTISCHASSVTYIA
jgi:hypothetical protein